MTNTYRVEVQGTPGWKNYRRATLGISVGQPYHEGEKFAATVAWAARHFDALHVLVADTLQRHNAPGDWRARGDAWLANNRASWLGCGRPVTVSRWDDWLSRPEFPAVLAQFQAAAIGGELGATVDRDAQAFVARHAARGVAVSTAQSKAYLLEELAAITLQAREYPGARIYPGIELESFHTVAAELAGDVPHGLEGQYHTAVELKRRASARPVPAPRALMIA